MKRTLKYILLFFLFANLSELPSYAQELAIGERCPDIEMNQVINHPAASLKLSEYRGKWVILDFWGPACISCIEAFPKLEALQEQFHDRLQVILVNKESKDSTERFFAKRKKIKMPALPMITGDTLLTKFFPPFSLPWQVWIDQNGIIRYITEAYNATAEHIQAILNDEKVGMKEIEYFSPPKEESLLFGSMDKRLIDKIQYYSYIMYCVRGLSVPNYTLTNDKGEVYHLSRNCTSIADLFITAYSEGDKYDLSARNALILVVKDTSKYLYPTNANELDQWSATNQYNYDLLIPEEHPGNAYRVMQQDLTRFFHVDARVEKRKIKCLVLTKQKNRLMKFKSKGGKPEMNLWVETSDSVRYIHNLPLEKLVSKLRSQAHYLQHPYPVIDATGYSGNVDITINKDAIDNLNISELRAGLKKYGLDLTEQDWITNVLVIKEPKEQSKK